MATPCLARLEEVIRRQGIELHGAPGAIERFVVVREGWFAGRSWRLGDVIACEPLGTPHASERAVPVVLAAQGHGRPRFGTAHASEVRGDVGEPCSPRRWRIAGRIATVLGGDEELVEACERFAASEAVLATLPWARLERAGRATGAVVGAGGVGSASLGSGDSSASPTAPQLSLFARAA
jgi:hypothetical protein